MNIFLFRTQRETSLATGDNVLSMLSEQEATIKDLEQKVANLFMDNVSLTTKLKASREGETEHMEKIVNLEERLLLALEGQVNMHFCTLTQSPLILFEAYPLLYTAGSCHSRATCIND